MFLMFFTFRSWYTATLSYLKPQRHRVHRVFIPHKDIVELNASRHWRHRVFAADVSVSPDVFRRHTLHPQNIIA